MVAALCGRKPPPLRSPTLEEFPMSNALIHESSPYLRQHAANPVDWRPWGDAAFAEARRLGKPVLLSIGYSTCHWCHVMAGESFENPATAARMNELFVNVKVDREERPDLDQIYQNAHMVLTGRHGGWPLTLFLAHDRTPFWGGTYFPDQPRYGLPAFADLLVQVAEVWRRSGGEIERQNASLRAMLEDAQPRGAAKTMDERPMRVALRILEENFDPLHGGFGGAPKFPKPGELAFLLARHAAWGEEKPLAMALYTIQQICAGGIHDQLGGGIFRYSVDERWMIPHFEKMLYDNALLLDVLGDAWQASGDESLRNAAASLVDWLCREMRAPGGGFYAALDADSEHHEGRHYVWTLKEVAAVLNGEEYALAALCLGFTGPPNFEGQFWHPRLALGVEDAARQLAIPLELARRRLATALAKLAVERARRPRPARDDKQLTAWNALTARALARAGQRFARPDWLKLARDTLDFLRNGMWRDGRLLACHIDGVSHLDAYLDDYAFLLDALLAMMQADFRRIDLDFAIALADGLLADFEDAEEGGFYFTAHRHETLMVRPKPGGDGVLPGGNSVATLALQRLGHLLGEPRYLAAAERALRLFYPQISEHPASYLGFLGALDEFLVPPSILVLRGPPHELTEWRRALADLAASETLLFALPNELAELPGCLAKPATTTVNAWLCRGVKCLPPMSKPDEVRQVFKAGKLG